MLQIKVRRLSRPGRVEIIETALIVGLAMLVIIKGGGAVGGVFLGLGQMMAVVISAAMQ